MMPDLSSALFKAASMLEEQGYRYAVIGGLAVSVWGQTRATYDIDFKVLVPANGYQALRELVRRYYPERARPHVPENPLIVDVVIEGVTVDFLLAIPGYEENIVTRALPRELGERAFPVCSPEDLIIQKAVAGRPRDWQDVEGILIEQYGKLQADYIEEWLGQFAEILERPEILTLYAETRERISRWAESQD
jgi:hypothetical protein